MRLAEFLILGFIAATAWAKAYPSKPVRVVVPYPAGSTPDNIGRTLAERLQKALGQPFVVENRSGAGGNIGTEAVVRAPADGHTLLVGGNGPVAINKHLYKSLSFDPERDLAPISLLASAPQLLVETAKGMRSADTREAGGSVSTSSPARPRNLRAGSASNLKNGPGWSARAAPPPTETLICASQCVDTV